MMEEKSSLILLEDIVPLEFEAGGSLAPAVEAIDAALPVEELKKKRKYKKEDGTSSDGMEEEVEQSSMDIVQLSAIDVVQESAVDVQLSDINVQPSEIGLQPIEFDPLASPSGVVGEVPGETLDAKSKAALRMRQYRKDHKNDPIWLSKEAERMRKIRANRKNLSANELQGGFVDENGVAIASPEGAVGEGSSSGESSFIEGQLDDNGVEIPRPKEIAPKKKRARKSTSKDIPQTSVASDLAAIGAVAVDSVDAVEVTAENSSAGLFMSNGTDNAEGVITAFAEMPGILAVEIQGDANFPSVPKKTKSDEFRKKEADRIRKYRELKRQDFEWKAKDAERMRVYRARLKEGAPEGRVKAKRAPSVGGEGKTRTKRKPAAQSSSMQPPGPEQQLDQQGMPIPLPYEPYEPEQFGQSSAISAEEVKEKEDSDSEDEPEKSSEASTGMLIDETNPIV
jgi:hypothetical protein